MRGSGARPLQSRRRGIVLRLTAWLMFLVGGGIELAGFAGVVIVVSKATHNMRATIYLSGAVAAVAAIVGYLATRWSRRIDILGRQHLSQIIDAPHQLQPESFVLYLRSFQDDQARQSIEWKYMGDEANRIQNLLLSSLTEEEQLVAALKPIGPVVALGRPGEALPLVGARRIYEADEAWRDTVLELMKKARLVVLALGPGNGLVWELLQAVQVLSPDRLILIVLMERDAYNRFRKNVAKEISAAGLRSRIKQPPSALLPAYPAAENFRHSEGWLIRFEGNWRADTVLLGLPSLPVLKYRRQFQKCISRALQPVLRDIREGRHGSLRW
jgi:hypothetical protein